MAGPNRDHHVDVTDTFDAKLAALRAHESQTAHMDDLDGLIRGWLTLNAERFGLREGRLGRDLPSRQDRLSARVPAHPQPS